MFSYVMSNEKNLIDVVKEGEVVGSLKYAEKDGLVSLDMFKIPSFDSNDMFDNYFKVMATISKDLESFFKEKFANLKKIVWGAFPEIKDYDLFATDIDQNYTPKTSKLKNKR